MEISSAYYFPHVWFWLSFFKLYTKHAKEISSQPHVFCFSVLASWILLGMQIKNTWQKFSMASPPRLHSQISESPSGGSSCCENPVFRCVKWLSPANWGWFAWACIFTRFPGIGQRNNPTQPNNLQSNLDMSRLHGRKGKRVVRFSLRFQYSTLKAQSFVFVAICTRIYIYIHI